jgi:hypothetical protein
MSIGRIFVVAGSLVAAAGAAGLTVFGSAPVEVFEIMMVRITAEGTDPLPDAIGHFFAAAICALLLVVGVVTVCAGLGLPSRRHSITFIGRFLVVIGGVGILAAAIPIAWGLLGTRAAFLAIATASTAPKPDELQAAIDLNSSLLTTGYWVLVAALAFPLLAGLVGFQRCPTDRWLAVAPLLCAAMAGLAGLCYVVLFYLSWQQSVSLEKLFTGPDVVVSRPSELAGHLNAILTISLIGCPLSILIGMVVGMAGLLAPRAKREK